jgi:hypothetical protein
MAHAPNKHKDFHGETASAKRNRSGQFPEELLSVS